MELSSCNLGVIDRFAGALSFQGFSLLFFLICVSLKNELGHYVLLSLLGAFSVVYFISRYRSKVNVRGGSTFAVSMVEKGDGISVTNMNMKAGMSLSGMCLFVGFTLLFLASKIYVARIAYKSYASMLGLNFEFLYILASVLISLMFVLVNSGFMPSDSKLFSTVSKFFLCK